MALARSGRSRTRARPAPRQRLTHGLSAIRHLVLEDEVPDDFEALIEQMIAETGAVGELAARLARRLAIAFWKGERAERIEVALFDAAPKRARTATGRKRPTR